MSGDEKAEGAMGKLRAFLCPAGVAKVLILGLIIRLAIAPWTSYTFDTHPFYSASVDMLAGAGMYGHAVYSYPPGFGLVLYPFMLLLSLFMDPSMFGSFQPGMIETGVVTSLITPFVTSPAFNLAYKAPLIIGDMLTASMLYVLVLDWKGEKAGRIAYMLWFLNPLVIWIGAVMGQFDVLAVLCTLLAVYFFLRDRYALAGLAMGAGVMMKVYPAYLGFLFLALLLLDQGAEWKARLRSTAKLAGGFLISLLSAVPFLFTTPAMLDMILRRAGNDSYGGVNIWFLSPLSGGNEVGGATGQSVLGILQSPIFTMLIGFILAVVISVILARSDRPLRDKVFTGSLFILVIALLFRSVTNPQHILWVLPFVVLASLSDPRFRTPMLLLTLSGLLASLSLCSPAAFLYPTAVYTPFLELEQLNAWAIAYFNNPIINPLYVLVMVNAIGVVALILILLHLSTGLVKRLREKLLGAEQ